MVNKTREMSWEVPTDLANTAHRLFDFVDTEITFVPSRGFKHSLDHFALVFVQQYVHDLLGGLVAWPQNLTQWLLSLCASLDILLYRVLLRQHRTRQFLFLDFDGLISVFAARLWRPGLVSFFDEAWENFYGWGLRRLRNGRTVRAEARFSLTFDTLVDGIAAREGRNARRLTDLL